MEITPLSAVKKKQIQLPSDLKDSLEKYASYLAERDGGEFAIGDIINALLNDRKRLAAIQGIEKEKVQKTSISMPKGSWEKLDQVAKNTEQRKEEVVSYLASGLLKDKSYLKWKKKSLSSQENM